MFVPSDSTVPKYQTAQDLQGDELLHYDTEIEVINLILLSIPNEIYNSVDACTTAKEMWKRVEREALVSVYNRFAQLINDLEQNKMIFPIVTINTKFMNSLQPEWLKYVTQVCLAKRLTVDSFDDLFDYLQQFEKLINASRAKKLEKSHDPLTLVLHTGSSSRNTSSYYVTHLTSVVYYDDEYQQDDVQTNSEDPLASAMLLLARAITQNFSNPTNNRLRTSSNTRNQAIIQGDRVNIQRRNPGNTSTVQCYNCSGKGHYARNCPKPRVRDSKYFMEQMLLAKQDEAGVLLTDEQNDFLFDDASKMEEIEELSANICLMAIIQPANNTSDAGPSYDYAFIREQLARNAYKEAEKQELSAQKVQQQNTTLTSQLELYKEKVRVLENIKGDNNYLNKFLEAHRQAKHFNQQAQSQFVRNRDIIRDLEKQQDKLDLAVTDYKRKNEELQKTRLILKRQMSENEDRYHDTILDLEAKLKKNVDLILKLGNSLQGMFMLGPKPLSVYDPQLKHGLGYPNPYTLKQAISQCPKLYLASSLSNSEIPLNVRDTEDTLDDASKSQQKMKEKMNDPIVVANKQNCWTIDYKQINALYKDFVPQKELSAEQKYFSSSFIPSDKTPNATSSIPASMRVMNAASSVRRPMNRDSHVKNSVLANSKNSAKKVAVYVRRNKQTDNTSANVISNKENGNDVNVANAAKAKTLLCVSCTQNVVLIVLWIVDSGCSKHMTGDRSLLRNFIKKFMGTVRFENDNFTAITGYGDYIQTCYVRNLEGDDLLTGGRKSNLYTISISNMAASSPVFLMSKATSTKSWLWHRRLSHLNFGTINDLTRLDLVDGLPKFKYGKDHLCSACERGKSKKASHPPKLVPSDHSKLELLYMDLCDPIRVASINGKKYILVIVDDYSRYTCVYFLHSKDETPEIIKNSLLKLN
ncbi:integrase, catalytic region, zinc finger, CCHC-type containing protein [Tanacetum coccineum]